MRPLNAADAAVMTDEVRWGDDVPQAERNRMALHCEDLVRRGLMFRAVRGDWTSYGKTDLGCLALRVRAAWLAAGGGP